MKKLYDTLGLPTTATDAEVKKAYRKLALKYHPDKNPGDSAAEEKFKAVAEAYDILSNPKKKAQYQRQQNPFGSGSGWSGSGPMSDSMFDDLLRNSGFADMFNQQYGYAERGRGRDVKARIQITLEEAYYGTSRRMTIGIKNLDVDIPKGITNGQQLRIKGQGQKGMTEDLNGDLILHVNILEDSRFYMDAQGLHTVVRVPLYDAMLGCKRTVEVFDKTISFTIPQGSPNGKVLRIRGRGMPKWKREGQYGNLLVTVIVDFPEGLSETEINLFKKLKETRIDIENNGKNE